MQTRDEVNEEEKKEMQDEEVALKESQENPESESKALGITRTYSEHTFAPCTQHTNKKKTLVHPQSNFTELPSE